MSIRLRQTDIGVCRRSVQPCPNPKTAAGMLSARPDHPEYEQEDFFAGTPLYWLRQSIVPG
jgi:hypothetical protein